MSENQKKQNHVRWDRILLVLALLAALVGSLTWCVRNIHGKDPAAQTEASSETESTASESTVPEAVPEAETPEEMPQESAAQQETPSELSDGEEGSAEEPAPEQPAVDLTAWNMILADPWNALPEDFAPQLTTVYGYQVDERIVEDLTAMFDAAAADGVDLMICSAYRSVSYQQGLFERKVNEYLGYGYSQDQATATAATIVAVPGTSEHHTGLALDIVTPSHQVLDDAFADTEAAQWLKANAPDYGFILRYPADKTVQTGIIFEPWHYRYVGRDYARTITDTGLCFEEWLDTVA